MLSRVGRLLCTPVLPLRSADVPPLLPPSAGEQNSTGTKKCWYCANGTVTVTTSGALGQLGSTACQAW